MKNDAAMARYLNGFRLHCTAEGRSPNTVIWYEHKLRIFCDWLDEHFNIQEPDAITADHIRDFLAHMRDEVHPGDLNPHRTSEDRLISPHTVQGYYRARGGFFLTELYLAAEA